MANFIFLLLHPCGSVQLWLQWSSAVVKIAPEARVVRWYSKKT